MFARRLLRRTTTAVAGEARASLSTTTRGDGTVASERTAFADALLSEEMDVERDEGWLESPAHLDAKANQLRARAMELEHDADAMHAKAHRRVRVRAREMMRRAMAARDDARECAARARILREQLRDESARDGFGGAAHTATATATALSSDDGEADADGVDAREDGRRAR
jgi:hypothetical protein